MAAARDDSAKRLGRWQASSGSASEPLAATAGFQSLPSISSSSGDRIKFQSKELNRVLGGGLMRGSVVLLGGAPGIGKSTLLLQLAHELAQGSDVDDGEEDAPPTAVCAYISGEESAHQIKARAGRLGNAHREGVMVMNETNLDTVLQSLGDLAAVSPLPLGAVIIDSIQTMFLTDLSAAAGSIVQVRECALRLMQFAKSTNVPVILTGHVTKSGELAGPRVLEHMVGAFSRRSNCAALATHTIALCSRRCCFVH